MIQIKIAVHVSRTTEQRKLLKKIN